MTRTKRFLQRSAFLVCCIILLVASVMGQAGHTTDSLSGYMPSDSLHYAKYNWDNQTELAALTWREPSSIQIGKYIISNDSLITMTEIELDKMILIIRLLTLNIYFSEEMIDRLCKKYLPDRFSN